MIAAHWVLVRDARGDTLVDGTFAYVLLLAVTAWFALSLAKAVVAWRRAEVEDRAELTRLEVADQELTACQVSERTARTQLATAEADLQAARVSREAARA